MRCQFLPVGFQHVQPVHRLCLADKVTVGHNAHAQVVAPVIANGHLFPNQVCHIRMPVKLVVQPHALRGDDSFYLMLRDIFEKSSMTFSLMLNLLVQFPV